MFCYNCGKELPENAIYCPACGTQVGVKCKSQEEEKECISSQANHDEVNESTETVKETEVVTAPEAELCNDSSQTNEPQPQADDNEAKQELEKAPNAISSLVWSLVAYECSPIPVLGLVFGIIALTKSIRGRRIVAINPSKYKLKAMLTIAFILSIVSIVLSFIAPALTISLIRDIIETRGIADIFTGLV